MSYNQGRKNNPISFGLKYDSVGVTVPQISSFLNKERS